MASYWLAAVLPVNQKPDLKILNTHWYFTLFFLSNIVVFLKITEIISPESDKYYVAVLH